MEVDTSRQAKRKRSPETGSFAGKKRKVPYLVSSGKGEAGRDREQVRDEARSLYKAYDVLVKTGSAAASVEKKRSSLGALFKAVEGKLNLPPTGSSNLQLFPVPQGNLPAVVMLPQPLWGRMGGREDSLNIRLGWEVRWVCMCSEGSLAGKRLAARIIPRFMGLFPEELPKSMDCLLDLVMNTLIETQTQQHHRLLLEGLRRDALEGIGRACDQAIERMEKPEQLLGKVVHCLLRQAGIVHELVVR